MRRQPFYGALYKGLRHILANRLQSGQGGAQAVDVVDAPTPEPAAVGLLLGAQIAVGGLQTAMVGAVAQLAVHFQHVRRNIRAGRIQHLAEIAERQCRKVIMVVVFVKGGPAAILVLHPGNPGNGAADGLLTAFIVGAGQLGETQRQHHLGGVVHIGIPVVMELKSPAAGR